MNSLHYEFKRHPIRKKSISWIELLFPDGFRSYIKPMSPCRGIHSSTYRPNGFIWHNPKAITITPKLIEWVEIEFRYIFTTDAFLWATSINSAPIKLQSILKEFYE